MDNLHSVFVIGESRTNADNAITKMYGTFYMAFEVEETTFEILDFSCTHTIATTQDFLRSLPPLAAMASQLKPSRIGPPLGVWFCWAFLFLNGSVPPV